MAQAGIRGLIGTAARKWAPERTWLVLGIVLASPMPDAGTLCLTADIRVCRSIEHMHERKSYDPIGGSDQSV